MDVNGFFFRNRNRFNIHFVCYWNYYDIQKGMLIKLNAKIEKRLGEYQLVTNRIEYLKVS